MKISLALAVLALTQGSRALACSQDTDCGATCGSGVCSFAPGPYYLTCVPAGTDPGWCITNGSCQCAGATCDQVTHYCTYTTPPPDLAHLPDLTPPPDLTPLPDLTPPPDLAGVDFSGVDFSTPPKPDLSSPPDLTSRPDQAIADLSPAETPDLSVTPMMKATASSSGCDLGGGAQPAGLALLGLALALAILFAPRQRRRRR